MIQKFVAKLIRFPNIGREVPEIKRSAIREIIEGNFRIIYRVESDRISILTIRNVRQLLKSKDIFKEK